MLEFGGGIRWSNPTILIIIIECPNVTVDYLWGQGCTVQCSHGLTGVSSASCDSISCVVIAGHPGPGSGDSHEYCAVQYSTVQYSTVQYSTASPVWSSLVTGPRIWRLS